MNESVAMLEIRKIRDKNSLRHINMTAEEISKEYSESTKRFVELMQKDIKVVSLENMTG